MKTNHELNEVLEAQRRANEYNAQIALERASKSNALSSSLELHRLRRINAELLEACKAALEYWHSKPGNIAKKEPDYLEKLRIAIKKAE